MTTVEMLRERIKKKQAELSQLRVQLFQLLHKESPELLIEFSEGDYVKSTYSENTHVWRVEYVYKKKNLYILLRRQPGGKRMWRRLPFHQQSRYKIVIKPEN